MLKAPAGDLAVLQRVAHIHFGSFDGGLDAGHKALAYASHVDGDVGRVGKLAQGIYHEHVVELVVELEAHHLGQLCRSLLGEAIYIGTGEGVLVSRLGEDAHLAAVARLGEDVLLGECVHAAVTHAQIHDIAAHRVPRATVGNWLGRQF